MSTSTEKEEKEKEKKDNTGEEEGDKSKSKVGTRWVRQQISAHFYNNLDFLVLIVILEMRLQSADQSIS